jgi:glycerol-3-phosphate dehydrogenase (NAD+)
VAVIGNGNWGTVGAQLVALNSQKLAHVETQVNMWTFEEQVNGRNLSEIINETHENVKYLQGIKLPENLYAEPDLLKAIDGATALVFCIPHQFIGGILNQMKPAIEAMETKPKAISLIKGIDFDENGIILISQVISRALGIDCAVLMGANVAKEAALGQFCETTVGAHTDEQGQFWKDVFHQDTFHTTYVLDPVAVELCGALKNIVAIGAGFSDGLGFGGNTKAAIIRLGLIEMYNFCKTFYPDAGVKAATFFESCGVADLITTCYGGRNRKCAEAFVTSGKSWDVLEAELLGGQKLQGTLTAQEVHHVLKQAGKVDDFPLFRNIYQISYEGKPVSDLCKNL